jgi:Arc/MetJ family transcription regulator
MRTSIVIDNQLMSAVLRATGLRTKRAAVELGLKTLLQIKRQERVQRYRGKLKWEGGFDSLRESRT